MENEIVSTGVDSEILRAWSGLNTPSHPHLDQHQLLLWDVLDTPTNSAQLKSPMSPIVVLSHHHWGCSGEQVNKISCSRLVPMLVEGEW